MNHFHGLNVSRIKKTLLAGKEYFLRTDVLIIDAETFFHRKTYRFLTEHVLAGIKSIQHYLAMGIKRSSYQYGINGFIFQYFPVIVINFSFRSQLQCFFNRRLIDIAQCHNFYFRILYQKAHQKTSS